MDGGALAVIEAERYDRRHGVPLHPKAEAPEGTDWVAVEHLGGTADHLFIMVVKNRPPAVPLRTFASDEDYRAVLPALQHYLPGEEVGKIERR